MIEKIFGIASAIAESAGTAGAADASAEGAQVSSVAALATTFLPLILIFVVIWFMLIRPQRKKDKQVKEMLNNLKAGDRICTIGGIYGTIASIKDETITLYVGAQKNQMVVARVTNEELGLEPGEIYDVKSNEVVLGNDGRNEFTWTAGFPNIVSPYTRQLSMNYERNGRIRL